MATPTISTAKAGAVGNLFGAYPAKPSAHEAAGSFQGFLQKSQASADKPLTVKESRKEATSQPQAEAAAFNKEANVSPRKEAGAEEKPISDKGAVKTDEAGEEQAAFKKLKAFVGQIQETLELTEEEMQLWLSSMGLEITDLLNPAVLQSFFMQVKGIDISQLLTESETAVELKTLMTEAAKLQPEIEPLLKEVPKEEFRQLFAEVFPQEQAQPLVRNQGTVATAPVMTEELTTEKAPQESPKQESQNSGQEELSQKQVFAEAFTKVVTRQEHIQVTANGLEKVVTTVTAKDVFEQVVTKLTAESVGDTAKLTVQLHPEHLGKLAFQVVSRQGQLTGQFVAESEAVKTALEAQMSQLKLHLAEQGIRVNEVKVVVGDTVNYFTEDKPREQQQGTAKKKNGRAAAAVAALEKEEEPEAEAVEIMTGTVDFTA